MDEQLLIVRYFIEMFADNGKVRYRFFDDSGRARAYVDRVAARRVSVAAERNPGTWWVVGAYLHEITGRGVPRVIDYFDGGDQGNDTYLGWESLGPGFQGKVTERPQFI